MLQGQRRSDGCQWWCSCSDASIGVSDVSLESTEAFIWNLHWFDIIHFGLPSSTRKLGILEENHCYFYYLILGWKICCKLSVSKTPHRCLTLQNYIYIFWQLEYLLSGRSNMCLAVVARLEVLFVSVYVTSPLDVPFLVSPSEPPTGRRCANTDLDRRPHLERTSSCWKLGGMHSTEWGTSCT